MHSDPDRACKILKQLRDLGVRLALDDPGSGHGSVRDLKNYPLDIVKIDREFIADLTHDPATHLIVDSMVRLAHDLHMIVVAEGIESQEQYELSTRLGCDLCQGLYIERPAIATTIDAMLAASATRPVDNAELIVGK